MAISKQGILGGFSGKVGNVVGVQLKGENIIRAAPRPSQKPPTAKQRLQRLKFSLAVEITNPFLFIAEQFFSEIPTQGERKGKFISYVLNHVLKIHEEQFQIEWSKLLLSSGTLTGFHHLETRLQENLLIITWINNSHQAFANPQDRVHLLFTNETRDKIIFLKDIAHRETQQTLQKLPDWSQNETAHLYIFLSTPDNSQAGNSCYLGSFKIEG